MQNSVGQVLKALHFKAWREWKRNDFSAENPENAYRRKIYKAGLVEKEGQLFAGKQGQYIRKMRTNLTTLRFNKDEFSFLVFLDS